MSPEDLRDMKTMLSQLEADGPLDHTEGFFGDKHPGMWGTDFLGHDFDAKVSEIEVLKAQVAAEKKAKETLQTQLDEEKKSHAGTKGETLMFRRQLVTQLRKMKDDNESEFQKVKSTFGEFQKKLENDIHTLSEI
jgi:hypothetical protein